MCTIHVIYIGCVRCTGATYRQHLSCHYGVSRYTRTHTHARTPVSVTLFVFSSQVTSGEFLPAQRTWHAKFESRCSLRRWTMFPARLKSVNRRYGDTTRFRCPLLSVTAQMILMCPFYGDIRSRLLLFHIRHFLVDRQ